MNTIAKAMLRHNDFIRIFTVRNSSRGKVMFSQKCVKNSVHSTLRSDKDQNKLSLSSSLSVSVIRSLRSKEKGILRNVFPSNREFDTPKDNACSLMT